MKYSLTIRKVANDALPFVHASYVLKDFKGRILVEFKNKSLVQINIMTAL